MDFMLALSENGVHDLLWTDALLAEWKRVIVREQRRSTESAESVVSAVRRYFDEGRVAVEQYAALVDQMPGADPDDRQHMAAAVAGGATIIVTWNADDFPADRLRDFGVRVLDPDVYLCELMDVIPEEMAATLIRLAAEKRRPPRTVSDLVDHLSKAGVPRFADRMRESLADG